MFEEHQRFIALILEPHRGHEMIYSVIPRNNLSGKKLLHSLLGVETTPSAILDSSKRQSRFVSYRHAVDVNRTKTCLVTKTKEL